MRTSQIQKREAIRSSSLSGMIFPAATTGRTALTGLLILRNWVWKALARIASRRTLMPPAVDPTQPPMTMIIMKSCLLTA